MRIAYLDTVAGIAGDMTLAAFVDAGMPLELLTAELEKLPLRGFELSATHLKRSAVETLHIDVQVTDPPHYHRHLKDILGIIEESSLSRGVKDRSSAIFRVIAQAEATVHNSSLEKVHFHEVGAVDSIVDIVGTAICLEYWEIEKIYTSPVRLGSGGLVQTQHGTMPTPTPATLEILREYPTVLTSIAEELTTPTGAGIVKALSSGVLKDEIISVKAVGYGSGTKEFPALPNFLRIIIGDIGDTAKAETITIIETTIDDMNPQIYPYLLDKLLGAGAVDAFLTPVIMKKGRPGMVVTALTPEGNVNAIIAVLQTQTTTIGVRIQSANRQILARRETTAETSFGTVRVKAIVRDGKEFLAAEFEECRRIAEERKVPLVHVMRQIERELGGTI